MVTVTVGAMGNCVTSSSGYAGAYDLSGNLSEWEDSCDVPGRSAYCRVRGGTFLDYDGGLACGNAIYSARVYSFEYTGFRCCAP